MVNFQKPVAFKIIIIFILHSRGDMTMMAFYKASEKFGMECMQLTPAFEIDLFAEPDNEEYNVIGDEMENPFFQTPAGTQTLVCCLNLVTISKNM